jgi:hypothetical protein
MLRTLTVGAVLVALTAGSTTAQEPSPPGPPLTYMEQAASDCSSDDYQRGTLLMAQCMERSVVAQEADAAQRRGQATLDEAEARRIRDTGQRLERVLRLIGPR